MLITPEYQSLMKELHQREKHYGANGWKVAPKLREVCELFKTTDILDYGCGKSSLADQLPFPIHQYDPGIEKYHKAPEPADIVVCTDVLEHIEEECIEDVLWDLDRVVKKILIFNVALEPAMKILKDGRNAHILLRTNRWWIHQLSRFFDLYEYQASPAHMAGLMGKIVFEKPVQGSQST